MQTLELSIFRFCATSSYEYYFQKYPLLYDSNLTLFSALASIDGLGFDPSMGLRVQGLCVFDDVPLYELVRRFGKDLCLEPLSQRYVSKDLALDKEAMFARYGWFFDKHSFITPSDRYELYQYLWANTISLQSDESYLGDGFFLYVDWLLTRYPKHFDTLIHTLANAQSGVMSYAPVEALIYTKKPNAPHITRTIHSLISKVARFGQCPGCGRAWINELESMRIPPIPDSAITALKALDQQDHKAFIVFDAYANYEAKSLVSSTKSLLQALGYKVITPRGKLLPLGGYFGRILEPKDLIKHIAYNLALADKERAVLVFGDCGSYYAALFAQDALLRDQALLDEVCALYGKIDYDISPVRHIKDIISSDQSELWGRDSLLESLKLAAYPSTLAFDRIDNQQAVYGFDPSIMALPKSVFKHLSGPNFTQEEIMNAAKDLHTRYVPIASKLGGKWLDIIESRQDFSHLQTYNYEGYLRESARMRFAGIDAGADVLVVSSLGLFRAFSTLAKTSAKSIGRDPSETPTLLLPQAALLALGVRDGLGLSGATMRALDLALA
ncbi:DUF5644 domain-containing protein [Helicobacter canis]|uniref:Uncharacterized protein n=1 Tax=Helicobacter canis TaxID=29419 RepID=A0A377J5R7_9HELI|nr:DUF5644 domain-containing protein [Helicobacter canis]STO97133.1 Uncharacterised protein [Helicobacter canis]